MNRPFIRIGTRKSKLALAQTEEVRRRLLAADPALGNERIEIVPIVTSGDRHSDKLLADIGGKALFTKELEDALLERKINIAVHSMKDMESVLAPGLVVAAMLERADARDCLVSRENKRLEELPKGATIGTSSPRRMAQLKRLRPDFTIVPFRGNVPTRLEKLARGEVDATVLAVAGLTRLGLASHITEIFPLETLLPAAAQGAIGVECRADDRTMCALLALVNHVPSFTTVTAERAMLTALGGSCRTPIAVHATLEHDMLTLRGELFSPDGAERYTVSRSGPVAEAAPIGEAAGKSLLQEGKHLLTG